VGNGVPLEYRLRPDRGLRLGGNPAVAIQILIGDDRDVTVAAAGTPVVVALRCDPDRENRPRCQRAAPFNLFRLPHAVAVICQASAGVR